MWAKKFAAAFLALFAEVASAQTTTTPGGVITSGSTLTSGCVAGGVLRSISNMVDCSAGLTYESGSLINTGSSRFGDASLGSTTVPLTARLGTGSTANIQEWQNSAGTNLASVSSAGALGLANSLYLANAKAIYFDAYIGLTGNPLSTNSWFGAYSGTAAGLSAIFNTGFGNASLVNLNASGGYNTVFGASSGQNITSGTANTLVGYSVGNGITTGAQNTIVGAGIGTLPSTLSKNVIIADGAGQQRTRQFPAITLTEAGGAETVLTLTSTTTNAFTVNVDYMVKASDATPDYAVRNGSVLLACVNNATVVTCTASATDETNDGRNGGGSILINTNAKTLTYAITVDTSTANVAVLKFDIDSDMTVTAANITRTITINGIVTPS